MAMTVTEMMSTFQIKSGNPSKSSKAKTPKSRLTYAFLFEPRETPQGQLKFGCTFLIPKSTDPNITRAFVQTIFDCGARTWGPDATKWPKLLKMPLRDGDKESDEEAYEDMYYIGSGANADRPPGIVVLENGRLTPATQQSEVYSGCWGVGSLNFFNFDKGGNKGISCGLNNVLKLEDGPRLDGFVAADKDFADFETAEPATEGADENADF